MSEENKKVIEDLLNINPRNMSYEQLVSMQNGWWETLNLLSEQNKENKQLKSQLQQKENIIKEVREEVRILESNCDISNCHAQKLYQILDKENKQ